MTALLTALPRPGLALRPGDWVQFDDGEHQVLALVGTSVRLRSSDGVDQVVLASHLFASPGFGVTGTEAAVQLEPFGLLDGLPGEVVATAREWDGTWSRWRPGGRMARSRPRRHGPAMTRS